LLSPSPWATTATLYIIFAILSCLPCSFNFATSCWLDHRCHLLSLNNALSVFCPSPPQRLFSLFFRQRMDIHWNFDSFLGDPAKTGDIYSIRTKVAFPGGKSRLRLHCASETRRARFSFHSHTHTVRPRVGSKAVRCRGHSPGNRRWDGGGFGGASKCEGRGYYSIDIVMVMADAGKVHRA
jgi:hypothetical protein